LLAFRDLETKFHFKEKKSGGQKEKRKEKEKSEEKGTKIQTSCLVL
jgi:hypothetical protein